ncbi:MAG: metal-dependent hydrolase [Nanoarchaeota archaeon]
MMWKTHIALGTLFALLFFDNVKYPIIFLPVVIISSLLPDIDSTKSYLGKRWFFRPIQWFLKHRGLLHSFSFCILVSIILSFFYPPASFPFFLGYGSHLIGDAITREGIRPFWPLKTEIAGHIRTDGKIEKIVFWSLCLGIVIVGTVLLLN